MDANRPIPAIFAVILTFILATAPAAEVNVHLESISPGEDSQLTLTALRFNPTTRVSKISKPSGTLPSRPIGPATYSTEPTDLTSTANAFEPAPISQSAVRSPGLIGGRKGNGQLIASRQAISGD